MYYQKAVEILANNLNEQGFQFFLSLTQNQLTQIFQAISQQDQKKILKYLQNRNQIPLPSSKPVFLEKVKHIHQSIQFTPVSHLQNNQSQKQFHFNDFIKPFAKQKIQQNKSNYIYYEVVKKLMYVNGVEQPNQQSIKMMHSQLHTMFKMIFKQNLLEGLHRRCQKKKQLYLIQQTTKIKYTQNSLAEQRDLKKYLSFIFSNQYNVFVDFKRNYKQIKKDVNQSFTDQSQQDQNLQRQDSQNCYIEELKPIESQIDQQTQYFLMRTQNMSEQEFAQYSKCRYLNFMIYGSQKLSKFLDSNQLGICKFKNRSLFELISYILCKSLKAIIFQIFRIKNNGILKPIKITNIADDIKNVGNQYIDRIVKRARTYALKTQTFLKKAYQIFQNQFHNNGYDRILPSTHRIKLLKVGENDVILSDNNLALQTWKKNKQYRKVWFQRVVAQTQIQKYLDSLQQLHDFRALNQYSQYLYDNRNKIRQLGYSQLFKRFFLKITTTQDIQIKQINQNSRLQSLFN